MTRAEALRRVAQITAAHLEASTFDEATEYWEGEDLSQRDLDRLGWAVAELTRRLYAMGGAARAAR